MTDNDVKRLAEIRIREEAATPGPWLVKEMMDFGVYANVESMDRSSITFKKGSKATKICDVDASDYDTKTDAAAEKLAKRDVAFIAHARADVPFLLALLEGEIAKRRRSDGDFE